MIPSGLRALVLADFPPGTPLLAVAPRDGELPDDPALATIPHVLLEGLDAVAAPVELLATLHARAPNARLFALVSNAAHVSGLAAFCGGTPLAPEHPLTHDEVAPLFAAAGWTVLSIRPIRDPAIELAHEPPVTVEVDGLAVRLDDAAAVERACTSAFVVIADRA